MNFNSGRRRHSRLPIPVIGLSFIIFSNQALVCRAFTPPSFSSATNHRVSLHREPLTSRPSSTVDYDPYDSAVINDPSSPVALDSTSSTADIITASSIQSRSLSPNFLINSSILLIVIITIIYQVLSVDLGITRGWSPQEIVARIPLDNWSSYTTTLTMAPLPTKSVTSATVYTIGDILSQKQEGRDMGNLDRGRIVRSLLAGLIGHGPMSHVWYHVSEDFFDGVLKMHHWWDFIPKVVADQTIFGPIWNNSYILLLGLMQLQSPSQIWSDMKRTTLPLIISGLKLWPFVHCITYGVIPLENRLLWVDAVEIVWVTILASQANHVRGNEIEDGRLVLQDENVKR